MGGPLEGVTAIELAGIGPGPFCGMLLADLGAHVIRLERPTPNPLPGTAGGRYDVLGRGRESVAVDLKNPRGREVVLDLVASADLLFEGFRPGVTERLGLGPADCHARNPALVYGRMTGWGQHGPYAGQAGHDINYLAIAGSLHPIGRAEEPVPPLNLVGDFGGGALYLAFGMVCALLRARATGEGEVVDAAIVDGAASLAAMMHGMVAAGGWTTQRRANLLDGGCPYYDTYRCSDGEFMAVGALEGKFFAELAAGLGVTDQPGFAPHERTDPAHWPAIRATLTERFASATRDEWTKVFAGTDACVFPVLSLAEAPEDPHNVARGVFTDAAGFNAPAPAPRFAAATPGAPGEPATTGAHTRKVLTAIGYTAADIDGLVADGVVASTE